MKWKRLTIVAVFGALLVAALNPPKAYACYCSKGTVESAFKFSDAVFTGKVVGVKDEKRPNGDDGSFIAHIYSIEVSESWKGISSSHIEAIFTSDYLTADGLRTENDCDYHGLEVGQTYLLYAHYNPDTGEHYVATGSCSRTAPVSDVLAVADMQELGPGSVIKSPDVLQVFEEYSWLGAGIVVIIASGAVLWRMRRSRKRALES